MPSLEESFVKDYKFEKRFFPESILTIKLPF